MPLEALVLHSALTSADAETLGQQVRSFIADCVILLEQEAFAGGIDDKLRLHLQQLAEGVNLP